MIHMHNPAAVIAVAAALMLSVLAGLHLATAGRIWQRFLRLLASSRQWRSWVGLAAAFPFGVGLASAVLSGHPTAPGQIVARVLVSGVLALLLVCFMVAMRKNSLQRRQVEKYQRQIDQLRGVARRSAARRIRSCVLALNRMGVTAIDLQGCCLKGRDLGAVRLYHADLRQADFEGADLRGAGLTGAKLQQVNLRGADLRGAFCYTANLEQADLSYADLHGADFRGANLRGARLDNAVLAGARLEDARLEDASLRYARLERTCLTVKQLLHTRTLYRASLDPNLRAQVLVRQDRLLEDPRSCVWVEGIVQLF